MEVRSLDGPVLTALAELPEVARQEVRKAFTNVSGEAALHEAEERVLFSKDKNAEKLGSSKGVPEEELREVVMTPASQPPSVGKSQELNLQDLLRPPAPLSAGSEGKSERTFPATPFEELHPATPANPPATPMPPSAGASMMPPPPATPTGVPVSVTEKPPVTPLPPSVTTKLPATPVPPSVADKPLLIPIPPSVIDKGLIIPVPPSVADKQPATPAPSSAGGLGLTSPVPGSVGLKQPATPAGASEGGSATPAPASVAEKLPATPAMAGALPVSPGVAEKLPETPGLAEKLPATPAVAEKLPATPGVAEKLPATPGFAEKLPTTPGVKPPGTTVPLSVGENLALPATPIPLTTEKQGSTSTDGVPAASTPVPPAAVEPDVPSKPPADEPTIIPIDHIQTSDVEDNVGATHDKADIAEASAPVNASNAEAAVAATAGAPEPTMVPTEYIQTSDVEGHGGAANDKVDTAEAGAPASAGNAEAARLASAGVPEDDAAEAKPEQPGQVVPTEGAEATDDEAAAKADEAEILKAAEAEIMQAAEAAEAEQKALAAMGDVKAQGNIDNKEAEEAEAKAAEARVAPSSPEVGPSIPGRGTLLGGPAPPEKNGTSQEEKGTTSQGRDIPPRGVDPSLPPRSRAPPAGRGPHPQGVTPKEGASLGQGELQLRFLHPRLGSRGDFPQACCPTPWGGQYRVYLIKVYI